MTGERYYLKDGRRVRVASVATAHRSADLFEMTYRERHALQVENMFDARTRAAVITGRTER